MKKVYGLWLVAFTFKLVGAAWDTSWHFKYFFDSFSPPHNIDGLGFILASGLLIYHWGGTQQAQRWAARLPEKLQGFTRRWILLERLGPERCMDLRSLRITTIGLLVFLFDAPLDQIWHYVFGLDLTTWSPTHLILFGGTELMIFGATMGLYRQGRTYRRGSFDGAALLLFCALLLEAFLFATGQQEYGYIALYALNHPDYVTVQHMTTFPIPALLAQAATQGGAQSLATGQVPTWIYPLYQLLVVPAILQLARHLHRRAWTASAVVALYLFYRIVARFILHSFDFPVSFVPYYLIGIGLSLDLFGWLEQRRAARQAKTSARTGTAAPRHASVAWGALALRLGAAAGATAAVYGGIAIIQQFEVTPPVPLGSPQVGFLDGGFPLGLLMACLALWLASPLATLFEGQSLAQPERAAAESLAPAPASATSKQ